MCYHFQYPSEREIKAAALMSPETFTAVRDMSSSRSTPITMAMPSPGTPTAPRTSAIVGIAPPRHTRHADRRNDRQQEDQELRPQTQIYVENLGDKQDRHPLEQRRPVHIHRRPKRQDKPGDFLGNTKLLFRFTDAGRNVALDELVEKPVIMTVLIALKNTMGLRRAKTFTKIE